VLNLSQCYKKTSTSLDKRSAAKDSANKSANKGGFAQQLSVLN